MLDGCKADKTLRHKHGLYREHLRAAQYCTEQQSKVQGNVPDLSLPLFAALTI